MADCGAAGTTIDRAARALMGSSNQGQDATKLVGSLLGHAATGHQPVMPLTAPEHLKIPGTLQNATIQPSPSATTMLGPPVAAQLDTAWQVPSQAIAAPISHAGPHPHQMMHPAQHMMHHNHLIHQQQQQQQQHRAMAIFQHQQQIMQHQMQILSAQQVNQRALKKETIDVDAPDVIEDHFQHWYEGLEEDAGALDIDENLGHDGVVHGASIEELAAAWAQAEAEYEQLTDQDDPSNMWNGQMLQSESRPYEFLNSEEPSEIQNWMEEGMKHFRDGNLKEAIRSFEMELQHNNPDNAMAWRMLGRCHAENDQDPEAIKCLEAAVDRDPFSPESLLALGVSYVNELNYEKALENLKAWFTHNPKYAGMELPADIYSAASNTQKESAFEEVKQLLLSALEFDATDAVDVHEALGVIYNVNKDYDAAADSFRKALQVRPDDYQLWNKLGATLANGSMSDEALPAYHKALQVKPKYARAWLNMAISHSNLQDHDEAARCYLQTLSLNPGATHCWTYLRMALSCSERWDLLPLVFSQDLAGFKEHFDFVLYE